MTVTEVIAELKKFPSDSEVWNFSEGMPTPVSEVREWDEGLVSKRHVILL